MRRNYKAYTLLMTLVMFFQVVPLYAQVPYSSYTYNEWNESIDAPASYLPVEVKSGVEMGHGALKEPKDFYMTSEGKLYLSDTGNNRILILDKDLNVLESIDTILIDGVEEPLMGPEGICISNEGLMYVTQPSLARILILEGRVVKGVIEKPDHPLIAADFIFKPVKIGVDIYGRIYVVSQGCYEGLMQFTEDYEFMGYFGANKVEVTPQVIMDYAWKNMMSDEQRASMARSLPIEYSSLDCSNDGFVYTSTVGTKTPYNQIKKMNPLGKNTYLAEGNKEINFGDLEISYAKNIAMNSSFIDVKVDENGFIFGIDRTRGRVFERDQDGNLIAVFGQLGNQKGTFSNPVAIELFEEKVYVLDVMKNNITIFEPSHYEELIREATIKYNQGLYQEARILWDQVVKYNMNNTLAYVGQGKAFLQEGNYKEAMVAFKKGASRYDYSKAYTKYRLETIRKYAPSVAGVIIVLVVAIYVYRMYKKIKRNGRRG